jgi:hypothetical protein
MAVNKSLRVLEPNLTSGINSKDKNLFLAGDSSKDPGNRRLSGFDIVLFAESEKKLTVDPGFFIYNGIIVEETIQQIHIIPDTLYSGGKLLGTVTDPTILHATVPDNTKQSVITYTFIRESSISTSPAYLAKYNGTSWVVAEAVSSGGILDQVISLRSDVGPTSPLQSMINVGTRADWI